MTDRRRTPAEIEADIAAERAKLTQNLNVLQQRLSVDHVMGEVRTRVEAQVGDMSAQMRQHLDDAADDIGAQVRDQIGAVGASVRDSVKKNPWPLALIGAGLGWIAWLSLTSGDKAAGESAVGYAPAKTPTLPSDYDTSPADIAARALEESAEIWASDVLENGSQPIPAYDPEPSWARDDDALTLSRPS